jgi:hypothetical protein
VAGDVVADGVVVTGGVVAGGFWFVLPDDPQETMVNKNRIARSALSFFIFYPPMFCSSFSLLAQVFLLINTGCLSE